MAAIAAIGTVLSVAQTLFAALESPLVEKVCSILDYKSELESLIDTVSKVKVVLLNAADKEELSNEAIEWIKKLKEAVYDADDLLDEFTTLAEQQKLVKGGRVTKKVRSLISRFTHMGIPYKMSREIKKIRKQLDGIASNPSLLGFSVDPQPIRRRRPETCSYVFEDRVIGRENETKEIIDILLESDVRRDVSFLTIVGIGGLGKTTLAQLVYNHERIINEFPLRLWVCVGDHDQKYFDTRVILGKILESATKHKHEDLTLDVLQEELRKNLEGKKYLLVLDDLWNEDRNEYLKLTDFLMGGGRGSRILVTTRSNKVASVVGDGLAYELHGLSDDNSWKLFKAVAFNEGQEQSSHDLVEIGKEIVKKCANVPLALRVVGTLLYDQERTKWLSFQKIGLADIRQGKNDIMSILKFSYYHLEPKLKSCFSYCALFPKDYKIKKDMLISLWMAQGCIVPLDQGQSIEDAGEEYFSILVRRCFFQEVEKDIYGVEIVSCKIHDLMHDVAQEVAGKEMVILSDSCVRALDKEIHHLSATTNHLPKEYIFTKNKIRTYLQIRMNYIDISFPVDTIFKNWTCLRTLYLQNSDIKSLPDTIGKLLHLRYLDLSENWGLTTLPKSVTRLCNLQSLKLRNCGLKELPKDLTKLVKLRLLDISKCSRLTHMPTGMDKLTCLTILPRFVVGAENLSLMQCVSPVGDLKPLNNLKGRVEIQIKKNYTYVKESDRDGGVLRSKEHLEEVMIHWKGDKNERSVYDEEALLEELLPHSNLKHLSLRRYCGVRMPSWGREDNLTTFLPNLVTVIISKCSGLKYLASFGTLRFLKVLELYELESLEYIEDTNRSSNGDAASSSREAVKSSLFPSLEVLSLEDLPMLEGWWRDDRSNIREPLLPLFPRLSYLQIEGCPRLTSNPSCITPAEVGIEISSGTDVMYLNSLPKPDKIEIGNIEYLKALPIEAFRGLSRMRIRYEEKLESLSEVGEVLRSCSSTLRSLEIERCPKLRGLFGGGLEHLTSLESLYMEHCENLNLTEQEDDDGIMPWKSLGHTLRILTLEDLPKLVNLPEGMKYLTSLQFLKIRGCPKLRGLSGGGLEHLTSLESLHKRDCKNLKLTEKEDDDGIMPWKSLGHTLRSLTLEYLPELVNLPMGMHYLTSLHSLKIRGCPKLRGLSGGGLEHLTSLESLHIRDCKNLKLTEKEDDDGIMPWKSFGHTLRSLILEDLPKLVNLPIGMQYLTSLHKLHVYDCHNLEALPPWMPCLTSP